MTSAAPAPRRLLSIEWSDASSFDLFPRLQAGQLPAAARLIASGRVKTISPDTACGWDLPTFASDLSSIGIEPLTLGRHSDHLSRVDADELDPCVYQFFPADSAAFPLLAEALARLYSAHNAAFHHLCKKPVPRFLDIRYTLLADIGQAYAGSRYLPEARLAAFRLLDLLLKDLRHHAGDDISIYFRSPGSPAGSGFIAFHDPSKRPDEQPPLPVEGTLRPLIASLLGLCPTSLAVRQGLAMPLDATWLQPQIPPAARLHVTPPAIERSRLHVRLARFEDHQRLTARFPTTPWSAENLSVLGFANSSESHLLGAASITAQGGLTFQLAPEGVPVASRLLETLIGQARLRTLVTLTTLNEIPVDDPRQAALLSAGFQAFSTVTLWKLPVETMLHRARRMAPPSSGRWTWRPATPADVAYWLGRPEARDLLSPQVVFCPDLSIVAEIDGRPGGLVLIQRLAKAAVLNLLFVSDEVRAAGGGITPLMMRGPHALRLAGIEEIVFTTDDTRREAIAFAKRCGGVSLRRHHRFRLTL